MKDFFFLFLLTYIALSVALYVIIDTSMHFKRPFVYLHIF